MLGIGFDMLISIFLSHHTVVGYHVKCDVCLCNIVLDMHGEQTQAYAYFVVFVVDKFTNYLDTNEVCLVCAG